MTMPTIFSRILATTALCLAAVGVSSCVSQNCQTIWRGAYEIDKVWWVEGTGDDTTPIYLFNGAYYALGKMGPAKGTLTTSGTPFEPLDEAYWPILEKAERAYLRLDEESAQLVQAALLAKEQPPQGVRVAFSRDTAQHLTTLPQGARRLSVAANAHEGRWGLYTATEELEDSVHTTSEKYWRYPLSILTAVAVDVPLTLLGNTVLGVGMVVTSPVRLLDYFSHEAPGEQPATKCPSTLEQRGGN